MRHWIFFLISSTAWAHISNYVPSATKIPEYVDKIEAYGCATTTFRGFHPLSHHDVLAALLPYADAECQGPEWLLKEREFLGRSFIQSDARVFALIQDNPPLPLIGQAAVIDPLFAQREGRRTLQGPNIYGELNLNSESGRDWGLALSATPGWTLAMEDFKRFMGHVYLQDGYIKAGYRRAELVFGRVPQRFGDAKNGNLILGASAKPLDMFKFAIRPHWIKPIDFIGPFTLETWLGTDSSDVGYKSARLWGFQFGLRPFTFFEFGFLNLMHFGGEGAPDVGFSDMMSMLTFSNSEEIQPLRQQVYATQMAIWGPDHYFKFYNQLLFGALGRSSDWLSHDISWLLGVWFPKIPDWDVRVEVVKTQAGAYGHPRWVQGLTKAGTPLGHPLGNAGMGFYFDLGLPMVESWRPELSLSLETRNREAIFGGAEEKRTGITLGGTRRWEKMEITAQVKYQSVRNDAYQAAVDTALLGAYGFMRYSFF